MRHHRFLVEIEDEGGRTTDETLLQLSKLLYVWAGADGASRRVQLAIVQGPIVAKARRRPPARKAAKHR